MELPSTNQASSDEHCEGPFSARASLKAPLPSATSRDAADPPAFPSETKRPPPLLTAPLRRKSVKNDIRVARTPNGVLQDTTMSDDLQEGAGLTVTCDLRELCSLRTADQARSSSKSSPATRHCNATSALDSKMNSRNTHNPIESDEEWGDIAQKKRSAQTTTKHNEQNHAAPTTTSGTGTYYDHPGSASDARAAAHSNPLASAARGSASLARAFALATCASARSTRTSASAARASASAARAASAAARVAPSTASATRSCGGRRRLRMSYCCDSCEDAGSHDSECTDRSHNDRFSQVGDGYLLIAHTPPNLKAGRSSTAPITKLWGARC